MPVCSTHLQPEGGDHPSKGESITVTELGAVKACTDSVDIVLVAVASTAAPPAITSAKESDQSTVPAVILSLNAVTAIEEALSPDELPSRMKKFTMTEPFSMLSMTILSSLTPAAFATSFLKSDRKPSMSVATLAKSVWILKRTSTTDALADGGDGDEGRGVVAGAGGDGGGGGGDGGGGDGDEGGGEGGGVGGGDGEGGHEPSLQVSDSTKGVQAPPRDLSLVPLLPQETVQSPHSCHTPQAIVVVGQSSTSQDSESWLEEQSPSRDLDRVAVPQVAEQEDHVPQPPQATGQVPWPHASDSVEESQSPLRYLDLAPPPQVAVQLPHALHEAQGSGQAASEQDSDWEVVEQPLPVRVRDRVPVPQVTSHDPHADQLLHTAGGGDGGV